MRSLTLCLLVALPVCAADEDRSCVKVMFFDAQDNKDGVTEPTVSLGSGTVIACRGGKSLVLTNKHVCPHKNGTSFLRVGNKSVPAEWVACDDTADLALIRADVALKPVGVADKEPPVGTAVGHWGFAGGGRMKAKTGRIEGTVVIHLPGQDVDSVLTSIEMEPGESGSGLFDGSGKLVGVATALGRHPGGRNFEHCVRLTDIRRFLNKHMEK